MFKQYTSETKHYRTDAEHVVPSIYNMQQSTVWWTRQDHKGPTKWWRCKTGLKQINHEVSIMKNNGGMNHGVEGRQKQHANML